MAHYTAYRIGVIAAFSEYLSASDLGFSELINGEIATAIEHLQEGIGFNETVVGELVSTQKYFGDTLGFDDTVTTDHITQEDKEVLSEIGFADTIDGYNINRRKEVLSELGFNDTIGGYNTYRHKEVLSELGFNEEIGANTTLKNKGFSSSLGFEGSADYFDPTREVLSGLGFNDTVNVDIHTILPLQHGLGINEAVYYDTPLKNINITSEMGINDAVYCDTDDSFNLEIETLGFNDTLGYKIYRVKSHSSILGLNDNVVCVQQYSTGFQAGIGLNDSSNGENAGNLLFEIPANVTYKFYLTLTGANDSLSDYEITQLKTIQLRMKSGSESSYLGVTSIYSGVAQTAIDLRKNGTLILEMASYYEGVQLLRENLMEVDFADVRYDIGSSSRSITINGYKALSYDNDVVFLDNVIHKKTSQDGRVSYRFARPNFYVRPGYKVVHGLENFIVDEVAFYVGNSNFHMDLYFDSDTISGTNQSDIYQSYLSSTDRERKFTALLTGSQDSLSDYNFSSIVAIQVRFRAGNRSYASLKVLHSQEMQDAITARPHGDIIINVIDGIGASSEQFITVNFNEVSYDLLASSRSATLVGYKVINFTFANSYSPVDVISERVKDDGSSYLKSISPNVDITPGYTLSYNGKSFIAGEVNFNFQEFSQYMEVFSIANVENEAHAESILDLKGSVVSNIFYKPYTDQEIGYDDNAHVSKNGIQQTYHDSCEVGFNEFIGCEKV